MHRPLFGHGLGTSLEANANFGDLDQLSHNLYAEVAQELGFIGLAIYLLFIKSILTSLSTALSAVRRMATLSPFLSNLALALKVWLVMNIVFSFASYGLSTYEWYLFAGLAAALRNIAVTQSEASLLHADLGQQSVPATGL